MKHAYLIMAHDDFDILEKQLLLLDDIRNDIYIHVDKKVKNFPFDKYLHLTKCSSVYFVDRLEVYWGDFSIVEAELILLQTAAKKEYQYYHLLSGTDMPLKSNDEINSFFEKYNGLEFIHFCADEEMGRYKERITRYYYMRWYKSNKLTLFNVSKKILAYLFVEFQHLLGFERKANKNITMGAGSQWFSITSDLVKYIISKEMWIREHFQYTCCSDELFIQTIVLNSAFKNKLFAKEKKDSCMANMRYIDWKNGNPYVFRQKDFDLLINSPYLFARKFNTKIDCQIVVMLSNSLEKMNIKKSKRL